MHEDNGFFHAPQYYVYLLWVRFGSQMIGVTSTLGTELQLSVYAGRVDTDMLLLMAIHKMGVQLQRR